MQNKDQSTPSGSGEELLEKLQNIHFRMEDIYQVEGDEGTLYLHTNIIKKFMVVIGQITMQRARDNASLLPEDISEMLQIALLAKESGLPKVQGNTDDIIALCELALSHTQETVGREEYKHYKGGLYYLIGYGRFEWSNAACAIYQSKEDGKIWIRPKKEFEEKFTKVVHSNPLTPGE